MNQPAGVPSVAFSHMGFYVQDIGAMENFYSRVLGFTVTDRGDLPVPGGSVGLVFLSREPAEHHQIVLATGRPSNLPFNVINQISFRVPGLPALRYFHRVLQAERSSEITPITHGNAISLYFRDPEGNRVELYFDTPWYCAQPCREPVDFGQSDEEILARTERLARALPGFKTREAWMAEVRAKMEAHARGGFVAPVEKENRMNQDTLDRLAIRDLIENWALWRDAGDRERFATVWHDDGVMMATWFQGPAKEFIRVTQEGWARGVSILHFLGGTTIDLAGSRAVAQTKMTISQRGDVQGVPCDVVCTGRFYDFIEKRDGRWGVVLRQPIYEKDRIDPIDPAARLEIDQAKLAGFPRGYRHLAYIQTQIGYKVKLDMPQLTGPEVEKLYARCKAWLAGAGSAAEE